MCRAWWSRCRAQPCSVPASGPAASAQCPPWRLLQVSAMLHARRRPHTALVPVAGSRMLADLHLSSPRRAILLLETRRMVFNTEGLAPEVPSLPTGEFVLRRRIIDAHLGSPSTCICELEWQALGDACRREEFLEQLIQQAGTTTSTSAAARAAEARAKPAELPAVQAGAASRQALPVHETKVRAQPSLPPDAEQAAALAAPAEAEGRKSELPPPPPAAPKQQARQQTRSRDSQSGARRPPSRPRPGVQHARASSRGELQPAASHREQDQARRSRGARPQAHVRSPPRLGPPRELLPPRDLQRPYLSPPPPRRRDMHSRFLGESYSHSRPFQLEPEPYEVRPPHRRGSPPPLASLWGPYAGPRGFVPPEPPLDRRPHQGHPGPRLDMFRPSDTGMWNERQLPPVFRGDMHPPGLHFSEELGPPFRGRGPFRGEGMSVRPALEPMWHQPLPQDLYQGWHVGRPRERFAVGR